MNDNLLACHQQIINMNNNNNNNINDSINNKLPYFITSSHGPQNGLQNQPQHQPQNPFDNKRIIYINNNDPDKNPSPKIQQKPKKVKEPKKPPLPYQTIEQTINNLNDSDLIDLENVKSTLSTITSEGVLLEEHIDLVSSKPKQVFRDKKKLSHFVALKSPMLDIYEKQTEPFRC